MNLIIITFNLKTTKNDTEYSDIQHNDTKQNGTKHIDKMQNDIQQ